MPSTTFNLAAAGPLLVLLAGCTSPGPPPLSSVLRQADAEAYYRHLVESGGNPRAAHLRWMAEIDGLELSMVAARDESLPVTENPFSLDDRVAQSRGAVVYKEHCSRCHGDAADGRGSEMSRLLPTMNFHSGARRFAVARFSGTAAKWFESVARGKTSRHLKDDGTPFSMPAFEEALAREQIWLAITYLMSSE